MPLYHLLNHIKELEKVNTLENVERKCKDTTTLLYLAQKDIRGILPSLALDPTHLPIQVTVTIVANKFVNLTRATTRQLTLLILAQNPVKSGKVIVRTSAWTLQAY